MKRGEKGTIRPDKEKRTEQVVEEDRKRNRRIREALARALCAEVV